MGNNDKALTLWTGDSVTSLIQYIRSEQEEIKRKRAELLRSVNREKGKFLLL